jgi:hypothetical protein
MVFRTQVAALGVGALLAGDGKMALLFLLGYLVLMLVKD